MSFVSSAALAWATSGATYSSSLAQEANFGHLHVFHKASTVVRDKREVWIQAGDYLFFGTDHPEIQETLHRYWYKLLVGVLKSGGITSRLDLRSRHIGCATVFSRVRYPKFWGGYLRYSETAHRKVYPW